ARGRARPGDAPGDRPQDRQGLAGARGGHAVLRALAHPSVRRAAVPGSDALLGLGGVAGGGRRPADARPCGGPGRRGRPDGVGRRPGPPAAPEAGPLLHLVSARGDVPLERRAVPRHRLRGRPSLPRAVPVAYVPRARDAPTTPRRGEHMVKDLYEIGEMPPMGQVPARMHAQLVRPDRFGEPESAIRDEVIDVPEIGPREVLVLVMAAGVNFNNVWAARGVPVDVTRTQARWGEPTEFHIVGSDASGIVWAVGSEVSNVTVGDEVVVHAGQWDPDDPWVLAGGDPGLAPSFRVWGYDTCWGSFAQFCKVQAHQCLPKAEHLTWEEAAAPTLTGATAYRMLHGWPPNTVKEGDVVLVWGAAGGLGSLAVQLVTLAGGKAVAVVSSDDKGEYAKRLGAAGYVN